MSRAPRFAVSLISLIATASGTTRSIRRIRRRQSGFRVFILEYHGVSTGSAERESVISRHRFQRHLRYLKKRYRVESLSAALTLLRGDRGLLEDVVVITFDDGYANNFSGAWPVLEEEALPATIFLTTGFLDGSELWFNVARRCLAAINRLGPQLRHEALEALNVTARGWLPAVAVDRLVQRMKYLPEADRDRLLLRLQKEQPGVTETKRPLLWSQVREMQREGIEMGGHTVSHPILSTLPRQRQEEEILGCWNRIAEETGVPPTAFSFPNGSRRDFDQTTVEILQSSGFESACTTIRGSNRIGCDLYSLRRIGVGSDPSWVLSARLSGLLDDEVRSGLAALSPRGPRVAQPTTKLKGNPAPRGGVSSKEGV